MKVIWPEGVNVSPFGPVDWVAVPAGVPVAGVPVAGVPVAGVPVAGVPVAGVPVAGVPVADGAFCDGAPVPDGAFCDGAPVPDGAFCDGAPVPDGAFCDGAPEPDGTFRDGAPEPDGAFCDGAPEPDGAFCDGAPVPDGGDPGPLDWVDPLPSGKAVVVALVVFLVLPETTVVDGAVAVGWGGGTALPGITGSQLDPIVVPPSCDITSGCAFKKFTRGVGNTGT